MKISRIIVYPIKSFRGYEPSSAQLTKYGFTHDRRFMVLHRQPDGSLKNMHVAYYPELVLMFASIDDQSSNISVTFRPPLNTNKNPSTIQIPLQPDVAHLEEIDVIMHKSPTKAYDMGPKYNSWLSDTLGYDVVLAYLGPNLRPVLMSSLNSPSSAAQPENQSSGWMSSLTSKLSTSLISSFGSSSEKDRITFADCAPYLIVSDKSLEDVSNRLPLDEEMDISKFRPNIIVSGADKPWEEDLWAELRVASASSGTATIHCLHNCGRCQSINIDYATGNFGTGESGKVLKMLQKDRRIDRGAKYSPVFGRYSFLDLESEGMTIAVGDEVQVTKKNEQPTQFDWPGLGSSS